MSLTLTLARGGGEISGSGTNIELDGTISGGAIESVELKGDTEQTTYSGKNLLNLVPVSSTSNGITTTLNADGSLTCSGTASDTWANVTATTALPQTLSASDVVVFSIKTSIPAQLYARTLVTSPYQRKDYIINASNTSSGSSAIGMAADSVYLFLNNLTVGTTYNFTIKQAQLEKSSSPTSYEPYVGGTASPNPDYPQEVQTVTGRQVVTISDGGSQSQEYEINLGDIELCKIGTYQDYIYKSGEDWYVKKEIKKLDVSTLSGWYYNSNTNFRTTTGVSDIKFPSSSDMVGDILCSHYSALSGNAAATSTYDYGIALGGAGYVSIRNKNLTSLSELNTYLANNQIYAYVVLATATDTQITNSALIAQLEALNAGTTYDGTTIITVASENLAGPLDVKASATVTKTYTEVEIGSPFTIADVEGKSSNTTLDGNVYVDWAYNKKQYSFDLFNLTPQDYADIRAFYNYQFNNSAFPTITVPELNIDKLPVYMEISSRNIINQCLLTDKLTIKFRETVQP